MTKSYLILITGEKLDEIYDDLKVKFGYWWKHMPSSMIVKSELKPVEIRNYITEKYNKNIEKLIVFTLTGESAWRGIKESGSTWLKGNL